MTMPPRMMCTRIAAAISTERAARRRPLGSIAKVSNPRAIYALRSGPEQQFGTHMSKPRPCGPEEDVDAEGVQRLPLRADALWGSAGYYRRSIMLIPGY